VPLNLSFTHIMVVMVVALIVLGPDKLPDAARTAARLIGELRRMSSGLQAEVRDTFGEFAEPFSDLVQTVTGGVVAATSGRIAEPTAPDGAYAPGPPLTGLTPLAPAIPRLDNLGLTVAGPALPALPALNGAEPAPGTFAPGPPTAAPIFSSLAVAPPEGFSPGPGRTEAPRPV
jgi:sec-independent protein translocase protein TatB